MTTDYECNCGESIEGYHTGDCSIFSTTTDRDLLAMIDATLSAYIKESGATHDVITCIKALRVVMEREEIDIDKGPWGDFELGVLKGYNQCLADIKANIKKELK